MATWDHWEQSVYAWVVICRNVKVHQHVTVNAGHKIPLAETDALTPPPAINRPFLVRCDQCGREYEYELEEVLRLKLELPVSFTPHPLFQ